MNRLLKTSIGSTFALGTLISGGSLAFAADTTAESDASVNITAPENPAPTPPVDGPTEPGDDTNNTGKLRLDMASSLNYGTQSDTGSAQTVDFVPGQNEEGKPYVKGVQVTDLRGTGAGWQLKAKLSKLVGTTDSTHELKGAQITISDAQVVGNEGADPATAGPTATTPVTLEADGTDQMLLNAEQGKGMASWMEKFVKAPLRFGGGQYADNYTGTITYTLSDAPA